MGSRPPPRLVGLVEVGAERKQAKELGQGQELWQWHWERSKQFCRQGN